MPKTTFLSSKSKSAKDRSGSLLNFRKLQEAAEKLGNLRGVPGSLRTRDLIGLLVYQAQRNKRKVQDPIAVHLRLVSKDSAERFRLRLRYSCVPPQEQERL